MRRLIIDTIEGIVPNDMKAWLWAWSAGFIDACIVAAIVYVYTVTR